MALQARCHKCKVHYDWGFKDRPLKDLACPTCGGTLARTATSTKTARAFAAGTSKYKHIVLTDAPMK